MSSYNFVQEITAQMGVWSSPLHRVVQVESNKIYFVIFGHSYKFLRILEVCTIFWELNQLKNDLKIAAQCWAVIGRLQCLLGGLPRAADRKAGWATAWRPTCFARRARCDMVTARSPRVGRRGGGLAGGPVATSRWQGLGLEHHG
jgi:hypothetical protein